MAKSQATYAKKEKENKRLKKRQEKELKKEERKANSQGGGSFESMLAYVDENGRITNTPPDPSRKVKVDASTIEVGIPRRVDNEVPTERRGKIVFFNTQKGFGFIQDTTTQEKFFVHVNGLKEEVVEDDLVSFELENGMKGLNAVRVKKVSA